MPDSPQTPPVKYFRPRKPGPESVIENAVAHRSSELFERGDLLRWLGGSLPLGAGMPDLIVVSSQPQIFALTHLEMPGAQLLAYLRAVGRARPERIAQRMGCRQDVVIRQLGSLMDLNVVCESPRGFALAPVWRSILTEIVTIEAKVANWRKAVIQAARNRIFAHRSFVALPEAVALRVRKEPIFNRAGIGILSVTKDHQVVEVRKARRAQPRVWSYYYKLASVVADHLEGNICPLSFPSPTLEPAIPNTPSSLR